MANDPPRPPHDDPTPSPTSAFRSTSSTRAFHIWDVRAGSLSWCGQTEVFWREFRPPRTAGEWFAAIHPNDTGGVEQAYRRLTEDRLPVRLEFRVRRPNGKTFFVSAHAVSLSPQTVVACLTREASGRAGVWEEPARVAADETTIPVTDPTFERFFELSQDLLCVANLDGRFELVNQAFVRVLGHPMRDLLRVPFLSYVHPDDHAATRGEMGRLTREEPVARFRNRYRTAAGEYLWLEWNARTVPAERRVFAVARDVTDRLRAEAAEGELVVGRDIQNRLYPQTAPTVPGFEIAGRNRSAAHLCGDYYDYIPHRNGRLVLAVGDVAGHGIGSALSMIETRAALRLLLDGSDDLMAITRTLHRHLYHREGGPSRYVTLFLGDLDPAARTFRWVGAGHDAHLFRADGRYHNLESTGSPLALIDPLILDDSPPSLPLGAGDVLVVLTDGLNEAACPDGTLYGTPRLLDAVRANAHRPAADIIERAFAEVDGHLCGCRQEDDMTMVVVKVE